MPAFDPVALPVLDKRVFPVLLACNFGINSDGVRAAYERGVRSFFWTSMKTRPCLDGVREALAKDRESAVLVAGTGGPFGFQYRRAVEGLLRKFRTDYIDVFEMFWLGVTSWDTRGVMDTLLELKEEGKIRGIGVTIHDRPRAGQLAKHSDLDMLQVRYNAAHPGAEWDIFPHLQKERRFITAYTATSWRKLLKAPAGWTGPVPTAADCYRFCLTNPAVSLVAMGPASTAHVHENLDGLAKGPMSDEELSWMRDFGAAVHPKGRRTAPKAA